MQIIERVWLRTPNLHPPPPELVSIGLKRVQQAVCFSSKRFYSTDRLGNTCSGHVMRGKLYSPATKPMGEKVLL
jgi:hypothetical protein